MEINKIFSTVLTVLLLFASSFVFGQQAEKTLVKSFNVGAYETVAIQMDAPVEVQTWNNSLLRIQIHISLESGSDALLKSLVQAGRYNLRHRIEDGKYEIFAPDMDMLVKIGGKPLKDKVSFKVFAPEGVTVVLPQDAEEDEVADAETVN